MRLKSILAILILTGIAALLVWAFIEGRKELEMEQERERPVQAPSRVTVQEGEPLVRIDQDTQMKSGIAAASLEPVTRPEELRAYGVVLQPQDLLDLQKSYVDAKARVEKNRAALEVSQKAYERLKTLHESNRNISDKALQAAEATWRSDEAEARTAEEAVHIVENRGRQQWGPVITQWLLDGSPALARLLAQRDILIQITLPSDARIPTWPPIALVQTVDGKRIPAKFVSPSLRTDPRIQGMSSFFLAPAQTSLLPGMNASALLPVGSKVAGVIVPDSAVVWWQGKGWVYIQKNEEHFIRREISTQMPVQEEWFVTAGVKAGDRIVTQGAQLLLSEELRAQIQIGEEGGEK